VRLEKARVRLPRFVEYRQLHLGLAPDHAEILRLLVELHSLFGTGAALAQVLGVALLTVQGWLGGQSMSAGSRRAVWLIHALCLRPERVGTLFHVVTWGRFATRPTPQDRRPMFHRNAGSYPEDYQI